MKRWAIVYNPASGSHRPHRLVEIERLLHGRGISTVAIPTAGVGHAAEIARNIDRVDCLAVYGGDGTLNETANGIAGRGIPLAFLPGGTANVMAHELGLSKNPSRALEQLLWGTPREVRPGRVNGRLFLLMAGFGFDAGAVYGVSPALKRWTGKAAYILAGVSQLPSLRSTLRVTGGDGPARNGMWVVAARAGKYGGRFRVHPRAGLTEPRLGIAVVGWGGLAPFLVANLGLGFSRQYPGVWLDERQALRVESDAPLHAQIDGDYLDRGNSFEVDMAETTVHLIFPGKPPSRRPDREGAQEKLLKQKAMSQ